MIYRAQPAREGTRSGLIVLAATNRVDMLDRALLRPGRFDRQITVTLPDRFGREAILRVHTRRTPLHDDVRLDTLACLTIGMNGAGATGSRTVRGSD